MQNAIVLPSGQRMPIIGLGTWQAKPEDVEKAVTWALEIGYRSIDTAFVYNNEEGIGKALESWFKKGGRRDEIFITTKLPNHGNRPSDVNKFLRESLKKLKLDYVDLYLVHHPFGFLEPPSESPQLDLKTDHLAIWKEMEKLVRSNLARNIGLSNFNSKQIERIVSKAEVKPANLQVELHVYLQQPQLVKTCKKHGISVTAYAPLGSPSAKSHFKNKYNFDMSVPNCLDDPTVVAISRRLGCTPAQVLIKFLIQMGIAVVPKSCSRERLRENFDAVHIDLSEDDMKALKKLDRGEDARIFDFLFYKGVEQHPEYPFPVQKDD